MLRYLIVGSFLLVILLSDVNCKAEEEEKEEKKVDKDAEIYDKSVGEGFLFYYFFIYNNFFYCLYFF